MWPIKPLLLPAAAALLLASAASSARAAAVPDFGFPRCYTSFDDATTFVDARPNHEVRPLTNQTRFPYAGATAEECAPRGAGGVQAPLIALGPHWSPIGLTRYTAPVSDGPCKHCLPAQFNGTLIVASHGSWNRNPFIGYVAALPTHPFASALHHSYWCRDFGAELWIDGMTPERAAPLAPNDIHSSH